MSVLDATARRLRGDFSSRAFNAGIRSPKETAEMLSTTRPCVYFRAAFQAIEQQHPVIRRAKDRIAGIRRGEETLVPATPANR